MTSPHLLDVDTLTAAVHGIARTDPDRTALIEGDRVISYAQLSRDVTASAQRWDLSRRSIVALTGDNGISLVVAYLGLLEAGHVPLLSPHRDTVGDAWRPAATVTCHAGKDPRAVVADAPDDHVLHPDLALLMSTSGSTGSPKLVRLSHQNIASNARSIAEYLRLTPDDRGITSLPLHYCYGLSVLHSHLVAGASVVLTTASVVDPCFRRAVIDHSVTNIAGVPHTFDLLDQSRFAEIDLPRLRFMTQAGGRMDPDKVARWADRLSARGAELFVMYGQTEATARIAYLPPSLAATSPDAIGVPVPGGSIRLMPHRASAEPGVGEIVYTGPNVMMGYAGRPGDLSRGHDLSELRTGDLGRLRPDGVYEIVGRTSRFVKPFGLRIDLDHIERTYAPLGVVAAVGDDTKVVVAVVPGGSDGAEQPHIDIEHLRSAICEGARLPRRCVQVVECVTLPRTPSGKVDAPALLARAAAAEERAVVHAQPPHQGVAAVFSAVLGRDHVRDSDTFVSLGGDSLSYIECGIQLEGLGGALPPEWHTRTVAELERDMAVRTKPRMPRLDTTVVLRAVSICAVVATHMRLHPLQGGAHLLLAVVGYNFARFQLAVTGTRARLISGLRTAARVAIPASGWIAVNMVVAGGYSIGAMALVNNYTGSSWRREGRWEYWFFEVFVQVLVVASVLLTVPAIRRLERRASFVFPLALLTPLLAFRFRIWHVGDDYNYLFRTHTVAWLFVLGWAVHRATSVPRRVLVSAIAAASIPQFFGRDQREMFVLAGMLLLTWVPAIPLPRPLHRALGAVASASMWIFLVHWQVWPPLDAALKREVAYALTILIGIVVWRAISSISLPSLTRAARVCARRSRSARLRRRCLAA